MKVRDVIRIRYRVVFEGGYGEGYSAYVPDLPVCVAAGDTFEETKMLIAEAVKYHLELMEEEGSPIPDPGPIRPELTLEVSANQGTPTTTAPNPKRTFHTRYVSAMV